MTKKFWLSVVVVFVLMEIMSFVIHGVILAGTYESLKEVFRPDMQRLMWVYQLMMPISAFFFVLIFSKGWEGKGLLEGIRFGLYIGIWMGLGFAYGSYAMIDIPYFLALTWFFGTIVEFLIYGVATALIYGKKPQPAA